MTDNNHPITPPPEIIREWQMKIENCSKRVDREAVVAKIFQLGADMELEACCEWLFDDWTALGTVNKLRAARRPKPPSLKELNLKHLEVMERDGHYLPEIIANLRRAIESLPD